ncbi:WSC domain-containing protein 1 [Chanos chanos]|uniref:WSC domain-containing protein 1 n=1 Tax=Chanos chanos TaxID=29144 RepID=A0A6J2WX08_CHACN|nr:WSC domain-containing protein 1-like [Chanos chanos]
MAKPFYKLQCFLRWAQLLLLFLGVAYIMTGTVLLLQRYSLDASQRGAETSLSLPSFPAPPRTLESPHLSWQFRRPGSRAIQYLENSPPDPPGSPMDQRQFTSRNLEIRHLRRHWFHSSTTEQKIQMQQSPHHRDIRRKGTYIGCFIDDGKEPALGGTVLYDFRRMTSTLCQDTCSESGYQFAGLEYGAECHCGNQITGARARNEDCNLDCKGDRGSVCGGVGRLSIYKVEKLLPSQRTYRNMHYHGCLKRPENMSQVFLFHTTLPQLTSQLCISTCTEKELPFAVLRGRDCFCGRASAHFALQKRLDERWCGRSNLSEHAPPIDEDIYHVYTTPVLDSRCKVRMFLPERSPSLIALSSFPGAGNTWLRHLIELTTGYYTGSFYFDGSLYNKGFKGEKDYWKSGRTVCVKTHESGQRDIEMFDSAILLIRNPYRSLIAEFNRKCAGHLGHASDRQWKGKEWPGFVDSYASWWVSHAVNWLKFGRHVLVVHFEDLQKELLPQLQLITSFLNVSVPEERLLCAESNRDGLFKRSGTRQLNFNPFTPAMRAQIDRYIRTVDQVLRDRNFSGVPQEYMPR